MSDSILVDIGFFSGKGGAEGVLSDDAWQAFLNDVQKVIDSGEGSVPPLEECSGKMEKNPCASMLDVRADAFFPDIKNIWRPAYEKLARQLDGKPAHGLAKVIPFATDPTALAADMGLEIPSMELPDIISKIVTPPTPPDLVKILSNEGKNEDFADPTKLADNIKSINTALAVPAPPPIPVELPDPQLKDLGYTDQYESQVESLEAAVKGQLAMVDPEVVLKIPEALGDIPGGIFDLVCSTMPNKPPPMEGADVEKAFEKVLKERKTQIQAVVFMGQNVGSGALVKGLASTPTDAGGFGLMLPPPPQDESAPDFLDLSSIRKAILSVVVGLLGHIPVYGSTKFNGSYTDGPTLPNGKKSAIETVLGHKFEMTYEAKYTDTQVALKKVAEDDAAVVAAAIGAAMNNVPSSIAAPPPSAEKLKELFSTQLTKTEYGDTYLDPTTNKPSGYFLGATWDQLTPEAQQSAKNLADQIRDDQNGNVDRAKEAEKNSNPVTNCGALPGYIFRELGCGKSKKPGQKTSDVFDVKQPSWAAGSYSLAGSGLTSVYMIARHFGAWVDTVFSVPSANPEPGDIYITGVPGKKPDDAHVVLHIGVVIDPTFAGDAWLTVDSGQGSAGRSEGMCYRLRKYSRGPNGISVPNETSSASATKFGNSVVLGWLDVDKIPTKMVGGRKMIDKLILPTFDEQKGNNPKKAEKS